MKTILTTAMILAMTGAPALAQPSSNTDPATASSVNGGIAGVGSSADAMSKRAAAQTDSADAVKNDKSKTAPSTSESPGVDRKEPKGTPSTASHTSPE